MPNQCQKCGNTTPMVLICKDCEYGLKTSEVKEMTTQQIAMDTDHIKDSIISLRKSRAEMEAEIRDRRAPIQEQIDQLWAEFNKNNAELLDTMAKAIDQETELDLELRQLAINHFNATGEKKLDKHISVPVTNKLVYDESAAVKWADINAPVMIKRTIDRKAFESLPNVAELEFVSTDPSIVAMISKDLEK